MSAYSDYICESLIINKKDIKYKVEDFESGKIRILFIIGLSGSGKTTLSENMAKQYKAIHIDLDDMVYNYWFTDDQLNEYDPKVAEFFQKYPKYRYKTKKDLNYNKNSPYLYDDLVKYLMDNSSERYIIEGVELLDSILANTISIEKLKEYAIILKGTSLMISSYRAYKRENPNGNIIDAIKFFTKNMKEKSFINNQLEKVRSKM